MSHLTSSNYQPTGVTADLTDIEAGTWTEVVFAENGAYGWKDDDFGAILFKTDDNDPDVVVRVNEYGLRQFVAAVRESEDADA